MNHDTIFLENLHLNTIIGIHDFEKEKPQRLRISTEIKIPPHNAGDTDNINHCPVNYAEVREFIMNFANKNKYELLESFAENLSQQIIQEFDCISVNLTVAKLDIFADTDACGIKIFRVK